MKKNIVVLSGAGMSAESGISTFRDSNGLWEQYRIEDVCTPEAWQRNPALVLDFYNQRRRQLLEVKPNQGHLLVASLERDYNVTVITQNVDDLHERAGSTSIIHLHGELTKVRSSINPDIIMDVDMNHPDTLMGDLCPADQSQLRPHIVWFGEAVPKIEEAADIVSTADILIIIGTSLNVYPAAGLVRYCRRGIPVYIIDPNDVSSPHNSNFVHIRKGASEGMKELCIRITG